MEQYGDQIVMYRVSKQFYEASIELHGKVAIRCFKSLATKFTFI